jgi:peptidoglycan/LPS O-acetylase OafA/YrhL/lysophospholipase L1-like esterase
MAVQDITARPLEWNPPRQAISRVPYLPGLDGLRAVAVVAVMIYHTNNGWLPGGFIGVEVFFVISGYLITLLLIGEHEKTGRIDLKQFWLRRARRLLPAVFLLLALLIVYTALFKRDTLGLLRGDVIAGLAYVTNWYQIWVGAGYTAAADFAPLRHLWSLAVEEQFYLFWPVVMVGLIRLGRRRLPDVSRWLVLGAVGIALAVGLLYHSGPVGTPAVTPAAYWDVAGRSISKMDTLYLSTISRSTGLLLGAAFAMLWRPVAVMRGPLRDKGPALDLLAAVGLAVLGALAWFLHVIGDTGQADPWLFRGGFLAVGLASVMVIAAVTHRGAKAGSLLGNPIFNWIGTRSYGLYLYHWPIYQIIRETAGSTLTVAEFAAAMACTAVITEFSYRFVEMPVRKRRIGAWWDRLQETSDPKPRQLIVGGAVAAVSVFGFAAVSMATADLKQNDVQESINAGEAVVGDIGDLSSTSTVPVVAPTTTAGGQPTTASTAPVVGGGVATAAPSTAAPSTAGATTVPAASSRFIAIGDSVMRGAASPLTALGFFVDARESIQFDAFVPQIAALVEGGTVPELMVIALGTNGNINDDDVQELFTALAPIPNVIVLTVHVDRSWTADNNELIRTLPAEYPNVQVLNWDVLASECATWAAQQNMPGNCFASDGFHLSADGADYYTELIRATAEQLGVDI